MNEPQAPATLGSLPLDDLSDQELVTAPLAEPPRPDGSRDGFAGITPPKRRGGAGRFITDVIVELGFMPQSRVDAAVEEGKAAGRSPEEVLLQSGALSADQERFATQESTLRAHAGHGGPYVVTVVDRGSAPGPEQVIAIRPAE